MSSKSSGNWYLVATATATLDDVNVVSVNFPNNILPKVGDKITTNYDTLNTATPFTALLSPGPIVVCELQGEAGSDSVIEVNLWRQMS